MSQYAASLTVLIRGNNSDALRKLRETSAEIEKLAKKSTPDLDIRATLRFQQGTFERLKFNMESNLSKLQDIAKINVDLGLRDGAVKKLNDQVSRAIKDATKDIKINAGAVQTTRTTGSGAAPTTSGPKVDTTLADSLRETAKAERETLRIQRALGESLNREVNAEFRRAGIAINRFGDITKTTNRHLQELNKTTRQTQAFASKIGAAFSGFLAAQIAITGTTAAVGRLKESVIDYNDTLKLSRDNFKTMLGSQKEADQLIAKLEKLAATSPFEFKDLLPLANQLLQTGRAAQSLDKDFQAIGDHASMKNLGVEGMNRIIYALSQMAEAGRVTGNELRQLSEAKVGGVKILAEAWGVNTRKMQEWIKDGIVPADRAITALLAGMGRNSQGAMQRANKTISGALSNISDAFDKAMGGAFKKTYDRLVETFTNIGLLLQTPSFQNWAVEMGARIQAGFDVAGRAVIGFGRLLTKVAPVVIAAVTAMAGRFVWAGFVAIPAAFAKINAAFATGALAAGTLAGSAARVGAWAAVITAGVGAVYFAFRNGAVALAAFSEALAELALGRMPTLENFGAGPMTQGVVKFFDNLESVVAEKVEGIQASVSKALGLPDIGAWQADIAKLKAEMAGIAKSFGAMPKFTVDDLLNGGEAGAEALRAALSKQKKALQDVASQWEKYGNVADNLIEKIRTFGDRSEESATHAKLLESGIGKLSPTAIKSATSLAKVVDQMKKITDLRATVVDSFVGIEKALAENNAPEDLWRKFEAVRAKAEKSLNATNRLKNLFQQGEKEFNTIKLSVVGRLDAIHAKTLIIDELIAKTRKDSSTGAAGATGGDSGALSSRGGGVASRSGSPRNRYGFVLPTIPNPTIRPANPNTDFKKSAAKDTTPKFPMPNFEMPFSWFGARPSVPVATDHNAGEREAALNLAGPDFKDASKELKEFIREAFKFRDITELINANNKAILATSRATMQARQADEDRLKVLTMTAPLLASLQRFTEKMNLTSEQAARLEEKRIEIWRGGDITELLDNAKALDAAGRKSEAAQNRRQAHLNFLARWEKAQASERAGFMAESIKEFEEASKNIGAMWKEGGQTLRDAARDAAGWLKPLVFPSVSEMSAAIKQGVTAGKLINAAPFSKWPQPTEGKIGQGLLDRDRIEEQQLNDARRQRGDLSLTADLRRLEVAGKLNDLTRQELVWKADDARLSEELAKTGATRTQEQTRAVNDQRAAIRGMLSDLASVDFSQITKGLTIQMESLNYFGRARDEFMRWQQLLQDGNLNMSEKFQVFDLEKQNAKVAQTRDTLTQFLGDVSNSLGNFESGFSGMVDGIINDLQRMATQFLTNKIFESLLGLAGIQTGGFTPGINGAGGLFSPLQVPGGVANPFGAASMAQMSGGALSLSSMAGGNIASSLGSSAAGGTKSVYAPVYHIEKVIANNPQEFTSKLPGQRVNRAEILRGVAKMAREGSRFLN